MRYFSGRSVTTELSSESESLDVIQQAENISVTSNNESIFASKNLKKVPEFFEVNFFLNLNKKIY